MKRCAIVMALLLCFLSPLAAFAEASVSGPNEYPIVTEPITVQSFAIVKTQIEDMATNDMTLWYEDKTGIHVEWECPPSSESTTRLNLSLASGDYPDFYFSMNLSTAQVWSIAQQGIAMPLNELINAHMPNLKKILEENPDIRAAMTAPDGNIYALLRTDGGLHMVTSQKFFVYKPWLEQLGMDMPTTPEALKAYLLAVKANDMNGNGDINDEIPLVTASGNRKQATGFLIAPYELQAAKRMNIQDGTVYSSVMTEGYREGLRYVKDLYDLGLFSADSFTIDASIMRGYTSRPDEMIVGASAGMMESNFGDMTVLPTLFADYEAVPPLTGPSGTAQTINSDGSIALCSFITTACEYPEAVAKWFDFWYSDEGALINYIGFEGTGYEIVDEPSIAGETPSYKTLVNSDAKTNESWYGTGNRHQTPALRYSLTFSEEGLESHYYTESLKYTDFFPAEFVPTNIWFSSEQTETINLLEPTVLSYIDEAEAQFITGLRDLDEDWDAYLAELESMGIAQLVDIYQAAYDDIAR